jgi:hypothetical protein
MCLWWDEGEDDEEVNGRGEGHNLAKTLTPYGETTTITKSCGDFSSLQRFGNHNERTRSAPEGQWQQAV